MSLVRLNNISFAEQGRQSTDTAGGESRSKKTWLAYGDGATSKLAVAGTFLTIVPSTDGRKVIRSINYNERGFRSWAITANYITPEEHHRKRQLEEGEFRWDFDTSGGTHTLTHTDPAKVTRFGVDAPDFKGAINVDSEGKIQGVETELSGLKLNLSYKHSQAVITPAYMQKLEGLKRKKNAQPFLGFDSGELLFLNASGSDGTDTPAEVTYHFLIDHARQDLTFGDITGVSKPAHDLLWIYSEEEEDTTAKALRPNPRGVYVHQIHDPADFGEFGLSL